MFRQGQLAVHGLAILLGRNEAGISNRGKFFLHHAVIILAVCKFARNFSSDCIEVEHRCILVVEVDAWLIYDGDGDVSDQEGREKQGLGAHVDSKTNQN